MSQDIIEEKIDYIKVNFLDKYPRTYAYYASKAFLTKAMAKIIKKSEMGIDVVSYGELYTALDAGINPDKIMFHGNNKSKDELEFALERGIGRIVVDGISELKLLIELAGKRFTAKILLRISPNVEAHTHKYISTGQLDSKFGLSFASKDLDEAIELAIKSEHIDFKGFHFHVGSQLFDNEAHVESTKKAMELIKEIKDKYDYEIEDLNVGGGFGVRYTAEDEPMPLEYFTDAIMEEVIALADKYEITRPNIFIEPGRYIVAEAGITLYTVGSVKNIESVRKYICIDGGMADNPRPALYQAKYSACIANKMYDEDTELVTVAGKCCESGDILIWDINLPKVERGDILAVMGTGAYNYSMSSNYNKLAKPAVVMIHDKEDRLIVQRESYEDLLKNDLG
jgi:diaminopimelate decarboxylase